MVKTGIICWSSVALGVLPLSGKRPNFSLGHPKNGTSWPFRLLPDYLELLRLKLSNRHWPRFGSCVIKTLRFLPGDSLRSVLAKLADPRNV